MNGNHTTKTILLIRLIMNPDNITLETMNRSFEYEKLAREIDSIDDVKTLRNVAKSYAKLFLKQKETVASIAKMKMDD